MNPETFVKEVLLLWMEEHGINGTVIIEKEEGKHERTEF